MEKAKKMAWHLLAASVGLLALSQLAHADSLDEQRSRYAQIKQAWDNRQMDVVDQLMPTLSTYPLYPYLQYRQITDDLMNQPALVVKNFIDANPTLPPARSLRSRFVNELARRSDWRGLLAFSPDKPTSTEAQCNYYYAKLSVGQSQEAWSGAKALWLTGKNQPGACEPLFSAWRDSGQQDPLAYLERIRLAMKAGNIGLVKSLAQQMPANYQSIASAVVALANDPNSVLTFARTTGATDFTRQMAAVAFASVARQDVENARLMIPSLVQAQQLNEDQTQELRDIVAWRLMGNDVTEDQAIWRDDAIMRSQSTPLVERRVRMALGTGDRHGLNTWLARLPMEAKEKDEWRYWQADLLLGALGEPPPLSGYDYLPLGELELLLVVAPQHPLARHRAPLSWRTLRRYRAVATGEGGALLSDQETLTVCDAAGQLALLRLGLGWGCLPRYQVQALLDSGELVCMTVRGLSPRQRAWIAWNDATCGLAGKWWRETLLANSAIFTIYHTETV